MRNSVAVAAVLGLCLCGTTWATLDKSQAFTDVGGYRWDKSTQITGVSDPNMSVLCEWVVNNRVLHNGDLQFEYVYQLTSLGTTVIVKFSVGMLPSNEAEDIGYFQTAAGDIIPTDAYFGGVAPNLNTANWTFAGLEEDQVTYALHYWSVNAPQFGPGLIQDGGIAGQLVPTPSDQIPEPATLALLAAGGIACLLRRRR